MPIDTHAHVFTRDLTLTGDRRYSPDYDASIPDYLAMLDRNGMSHGVLIQPSFLGTDNSYMLEALRRAPERLRGIAVVAPETDLDTLRHFKERGVAGIRLNLIGQPEPNFGEAVWERHLADVGGLGWQVEVQAEARRLPTILPPLLRAGVPVVVDHFGRPEPRLGVEDAGFDALLDLASTGRVWVKLSAAYRNGSGPAGARLAIACASRLRAAFGPNYLMWGSDWPHTQYETVADTGEVCRALDQWLPDPADRKGVLDDTPSLLFGFGRMQAEKQFG